MLTIGRKQMAALVRTGRQRIEDGLVAHVHEVWREVAAQREDADLRAAVRAGVERATGYGLQTDDDVEAYIDLMIAFGDDFDRSPQTPWAQAILADAALPAWQKLDLLWERAEQEVSDVG